YLVGRGALTVPRMIDPGRTRLQGPAFITPARQQPEQHVLLSEGRQTLAAFEKGETHETRIPGWRVMTRPIRASKENCVQCHSAATGEALKIGDPLGAAIY